MELCVNVVDGLKGLARPRNEIRNVKDGEELEFAQASQEEKDWRS